MSGPDTDLARLGAAARRGTSRTSVPEATLTPLGRALSRVQREAPEAALLARAALAGLHAQAGRTPDRPTAPAPQFVPSGMPEVAPPAALGRLLPVLTEQPAVLREALTLLASTPARLNAVQALPLLALTERGGEWLQDTLWPVLGEHARWLVRLHPVWKRQDPETPAASAQLATLRRTLVEAHAANPEGTAADLQTRWPGLKADERRVALDAVAGSLQPADWPLLQLATSDKLPDLRRQARMLQGHLPGEVQDAVRAALGTWFFQRRGRERPVVVWGESPAALGDPDDGVSGDSALARLLGAVPVMELPGLLGSPLPELRTAIAVFLKSAGGPADAQRLRMVIRSMERTALSGADLDTLLGFEGGLGDLLDCWPRRRIRALLWQATTRLLERSSPDGALLQLAVQLFGALDGPLPLTPDGPVVPPKKGLLARMASALGGATPDHADWPTRLHALAERLLLLSRETNSDRRLTDTLLNTLVIHLDPARPDPVGPEPVLPPALPEGADKNRQEAHAVALRLYQQQTHMRAGLTHILALRRQVRAALTGDQ